MRIRRTDDGEVYESPLTVEQGDAGEAAGVFTRVSYLTPATGRLSPEAALRASNQKPATKPAPRRTRTSKETA